MGNNSERASIANSTDRINQEQIDRLAVEILRREAFQPTAPTAAPESPLQTAERTAPAPRETPEPARKERYAPHEDLSLSFGQTKLGYSHIWLTRPTSIVGTLGMGHMPGPAAKAGLAVAWSIASTAEDGYHLTNSSSFLERTKFGAAVATDLTLSAGGLMYLSGKAPGLAPLLILAGLTGRLLVDLIPNRVRRT